MSINIERILLELELLPKFDTQISIQGVLGNKDPLYGTGKLAKLKHTEEEFTVPNFSGLVYTNYVLEKLGMYRTRLMNLKPKTCYSYHRDPTVRLHIPLTTNDNCFFVIDDEVIRYPADGNYFIVDTRKMHTAVNTSYEDRLHLVGCISHLDPYIQIK